MDNNEKFYDVMCLLLSRMEEFTTEIPNIKQGINPLAWYVGKEVKELMNISIRTIQTWRDEKIIKYSVIQGKFYYQGEDLIKLLINNKK